MSEVVTLKVYNKNNKLKFLFRDTSVTKTVSIYKYNGENIDTHSFTYAKEGELKFWQAYYELTIETDGGLKETVTVSKDTMEQWEIIGEMDVIKTTTNLNSGNVYEKRTKYHKGEMYGVEFLNGKFNTLDSRIREKKINEYLKK